MDKTIDMAREAGLPAPVQEPWEPRDTAHRAGGLPQDFSPKKSMPQKMNTATAMKGITQMNKSTIDMAREAGLFTHKEVQAELKAFEVLVRADEREQSLQREKFIAERWAIECASQVEIEREACASIVENADTPDCGGWTAQGIAEAIRNRGNT
jgi:hypothetical protein